MPVVAHHNHRAGIVHQKSFQPVDAGHVQVVGGFVQQDDVRLTKEGLRQQHLHLLLGRKGTHGLAEQIQGQSQTLKQFAGIGFGVPTAQLGVLRFQLGSQIAILFGEIFLGVEGVFLLLHLVQPLVAHHDGVQNGILVKGKVILLQHAHPLAGIDNDLSLAGFQLSGEDPQKGGFARPVGADNTVAVAFGKFQVNVFEKILPVKIDADIRYVNHSMSFLR